MYWILRTLMPRISAALEVEPPVACRVVRIACRSISSRLLPGMLGVELWVAVGEMAAGKCCGSMRSPLAITTARYITDYDGARATTACKYTGAAAEIAAATLLVVGARAPNDALYRALAARPGELADAGIRSLQKIGDCDVPGAVVHAVYAGHKLARGFDGALSLEDAVEMEHAVVAPADDP